MIQADSFKVAHEYMSLVGPENYTYEGLKEYARDCDLDSSAWLHDPIEFLRVLFEETAHEALAHAAQDMGVNPHDNMVELFVARFEALAPFRSTLRLYQSYLPTKPLGVHTLLTSQHSSLIKLLKAAGYEQPTYAQQVFLQLKLNMFMWDWCNQVDLNMESIMADMDELLREYEKFSNNFI